MYFQIALLCFDNTLCTFQQFEKTETLTDCVSTTFVPFIPQHLGTKTFFFLYIPLTPQTGKTCWIYNTTVSERRVKWQK